MSRALLVLHSQADRDRAVKWVQGVPKGTRLEFKAQKRTVAQNSALWAALTDIATQKEYHGLKLSADDWKLLFLDALKRDVRTVPNLDGNGIVSLGRSSSDLSAEEMSGLLNIIYAWGAANEVTFSDKGEG